MSKYMKIKLFQGLYLVLLILVLTACGKSQNTASKAAQDSKTNVQIAEPIIPKSELLEYLDAEVLGFPDYYGKNLDAFFDCLTELGECTIVLKEIDALSRTDCYGAKVLQVFEEAAQANPGLELEVQETEVREM